MQLISRTRARLDALRSERGFSMIVVMGVMAASSLFVAAAFAAANGDLPLTRDSQDRKQAYAAAEAGINFYQYHLNQDPDYWNKCTLVPAPNGSEPNPVNEAWNGSGGDPRRWRKVAGLKTEYTVELLAANGNAQCVPPPGNTAASMINQSSGTFKIRSTGSPRSHLTSKLRRTLVAQFRRKSFLDFLYFTEYETRDPLAYDPADQPRANLECAEKVRALRTSWCVNINFADEDANNGPLHTNDDIRTCGTPVFGRNSADAIEFLPPSWGRKVTAAEGCSDGGDPDFKGTIRVNAGTLKMPTTNGALEANAAPAYLFTGTTKIRFNGPPANDMTVTRNYRPGNNTFGAGGGVSNMPLPANGVIYVKTGTPCTSITPPIDAEYGESVGCANLYVSGTYTKSMTLGAKNDIIVMPDNVSSGTTSVSLAKPVGTDHVLGLIANNFVRVYHKVNRDNNNDCTTNATPVLQNATIESAILTLAHSFVVDNWKCGAELGNLNITGAIAQKYRGAVANSAGHGYTKNYNYDDRLRYRSPPYFLTPVAAGWNVVRSNEQVPAR